MQILISRKNKNYEQNFIRHYFYVFISNAFAQNADVKSASEIPDKLFAAMKAKNFEDIRDIFTPEGQLVAIDKPRDGKGISKTRVFTAESFAKTISEAKASDFIEKMPNKDVKIERRFGDGFRSLHILCRR